MRGHHSKEKAKDMDLHLHVLRVSLKPGEAISDETIADFCGCSRRLIYDIQQKALKKLRKQMPWR